MTRAEKIEQLNELGFKTKVENGTLYIYKDNYDDIALDGTIYSLMADYEHSYGVRPIERYEEDNGKETKEEKQNEAFEKKEKAKGKAE